MSASLRKVSVTTSWAALPDFRCGQVNLLNHTGADLDVRYAAEDAAGQLITLPDGGSVVLPVANASNLQIKAAAGATGVNLVLL